MYIYLSIYIYKTLKLSSKVQNMLQHIWAIKFVHFYLTTLDMCVKGFCIFTLVETKSRI